MQLSRSTVGDITFSQISRAYSEVAAANGVPPERRASASVLLLMAKLGELAALAAASGGLPARNAFESEEITDIIGQIAVGTCALGVGFGVDVGEAALAATKLMRRGSGTPQNVGLMHGSSAGPPSAFVSVPTLAPLPHHGATRADRGTPPPLPSGGGSQGSNPSHTFIGDRLASSHGIGTAPPSTHTTPTASSQEKVAPAGAPAPPLPTADADAAAAMGLLSPTRGFVPLEHPPSAPNDNDIDSFQLGAAANTAVLTSGLFAAAESSADERESWSAARGRNNQAATSEILLSPKTNSAFFAMLDAIERSNFDEQQFADLRIAWVAPQSDGSVVELVPNGRHIEVALKDFPRYLQLLAPYRPAGSGAGNNNTSTPSTKLYSAQLPPSYDPQADLKLFSPTHFAKGIFSPMTAATEFRLGDVAAVVPQVFRHPSGQQHNHGPPAAHGARDLQSTTDGAKQPSSQQVRSESFDHHPSADSDSEILRQRRTEQVIANAAAGKPSTLDEPAFWKMISGLEQGKITGVRVDELGLFFVFPYRAKLVELINNGSFIPVTQRNVATFLSLLQEQKSILEGHIKRVESVKTIAVTNLASYDPRSEGRRYSPTHYNLDVFAPHTNRTAFIVDYDAKHVADVLPPVLQRGAKTSIATTAEYVDYISANPERFKDIFQTAIKDPSIAQRMSVTYCMPDRPGSVVDLVPNGSHTMVLAADVPRFVDLVVQYRRSHAQEASP